MNERDYVASALAQILEWSNGRLPKNHAFRRECESAIANLKDVGVYSLPPFILSPYPSDYVGRGKPRPTRADYVAIGHLCETLADLLDSDDRKTRGWLRGLASNCSRSSVVYR